MQWQKDNEEDVLPSIIKRGVETFWNTLEIRKDEVFERLKDIVKDESNFLSIKPLCHRICKSRYTHKNDLEKCAAKRSKESDTFSPQMTPAEDISLPTATHSSTPKIKYKTCWFLCSKERNSKGDRKLILVATPLRQKAIQQKAEELGDKEIL